MTPETSKYKNFWLTVQSPMAPEETKVLPTEGDHHVTAEAIINGLVSGVAVPKKVDKWWGHELHYRNDDLYCMKWLHLKHGGATSMHYHVGKHETLLVVAGVLTVESVYDKETKYRRLGPGTALVVAPGFAHRLIAAEGPVDLIEASTQDFDDDSVRIS
jgi:mannose-6-phosphate isomerase-like protein (cupin superfamily)